MKTVQIPAQSLGGMHEPHRQALINFAQSIQPAINDAVARAQSGSATPQQIASLDAQIKTLSSAVAAIKSQQGGAGSSASSFDAGYAYFLS